MSQSAFFLMHNPLQHYDWGSHDAMTRLFGLPNPDAQPQAELWMGAHPNGCSRLETPQGAIRLDDWIAAAPEQALGHTTAARFGRLPFLFKVLAAEKACQFRYIRASSKPKPVCPGECGRRGPQCRTPQLPR